MYICIADIDAPETHDFIVRKRKREATERRKAARIGEQWLVTAVANDRDQSFTVGRDSGVGVLADG